MEQQKIEQGARLRERAVGTGDRSAKDKDL